MLGVTEHTRRRGHQRMRWLDGSTHSTDMSLSKLWETVKAYHLSLPGIQFIIYWVFILLSPCGNFSSMRADTPVLLPLYSAAYGRCSKCLTDFESC